MAVPILPHLPPEVIKRFWSKVDIKGPDDCWEWKLFRDKDGYGAFAINRKNRRAHRVSYAISNGIDPGTMQTCHHCDNPPCVNPKHLFLGTLLDNRRDSVAKGRTPTGDRNGSRKYPERYKLGDRHWTRQHPERLLTGDLNPSRTHPERLAWGDLNPSRLHPETHPRGDRHGQSKLTDAIVRDIRTIYATESLSTLAIKYGVSKSVISSVKNNRTWRHVVV